MLVEKGTERKGNAEHFLLDDTSPMPEPAKQNMSDSDKRTDFAQVGCHSVDLVNDNPCRT